jgi:glycosyltransferase involved in cell wall biosynthesis
MLNVAFVVRTRGLEFDDRVRKEAIALVNLGYSVKIFVLLDNNSEGVGFTSYGVEYESIRLITRNLLPNKRFLALKAFELYLVLKNRLKTFDFVWAHEQYTFMLPLLLDKNSCIWDLHELPVKFEKGLPKFMFKIIRNKTLFIIHANKQRMHYLINIGLLKGEEKQVIINNYPDDKFEISDEKCSKFDSFKDWLGSSTYVYLQGISSDIRYPLNSIEPILNTTNHKIVIAGRFSDNLKSVLISKYGVLVNERLFFLGMVEQLSIPSYLKSSKFTIVLYKCSTKNNMYCEANRLYQAIMFSVPVIVGNNPTMADIVKHNKFGIVLSDDGANQSGIELAINELELNYEGFIDSLNIKKSHYVWNDDVVNILKR